VQVSVGAAPTGEFMGAAPTGDIMGAGTASGGYGASGQDATVIIVNYGKVSRGASEAPAGTGNGTKAVLFKASILSTMVRTAHVRDPTPIGTRR
jgi:hypothetical protein